MRRRAGRRRDHCDSATYRLPAGQTNRNSISYWLHGPSGTNRDYIIKIDGSKLRELRYFTTDTSVEGDHSTRGVNGGWPAVIDIHGGDKTSNDDNFSDMDLTVDVRDVTIDATAGHTLSRTGGIFAWLSASSGDVRLTVRDSRITANRHGVYGLHDGTGKVFVNVFGSTVATTTNGLSAVDGRHDEFGDVTVTVRDSRITAEGGYGIRALMYHGDQWHSNDRNQPRSTDRHHIRVSAENTHILTKGDRRYGIYAKSNNHAAVQANKHASTTDVHGNIIVVKRGGSIVTEGANAHGIFAWNVGKGDVIVNVRDAHIETKGPSATYGLWGILAYNQGGAGAINVTVDGGTVRALGTEGAASIGVGVLLLGSTLRDADGYLRQTARIDGAVHGGHAGVYLRGGGRLYLGSRGFISGAKGFAVISEGNNAKLWASVDLAGRKPSQVLNGAIVNTRGTTATNTLGETVLVVNGVELFRGTSLTGRKDVTVPNGIWDIRLRPEDVGTSVAGQLSLTLSDAALTPAARGALYETLPALLAALNAPDLLAPPPADRLARAPDSPLWLRLIGGGGRGKPRSTALGGKYRFTSFGVEAGMEVPLEEGITLRPSLHLVSADGSVSSPAGKGKAKSGGYGVGVEAVWRRDGWWLSGRARATQYSVDLSTAADGPLKDGKKALGQFYGLEAGRRFHIGAADGPAGGTVLTPRVWLNHSRLAMGAFEDAVGTRVSLDDGETTAAGAGMAVETPVGGSRAVRLRGFAGAETALDAKTAAGIDRVRYASGAPKTRGLLGLGAEARFGPVTVDMDARAGFAGSGNATYGGMLRLSTSF